MYNPLFSKLYTYKCQKKGVPTNFLKSIFFMGTSIGLNLLHFFNFFAFGTEKFHFTPKNRAQTAKLSIPVDSAGKNTSRNVLLICGTIFLAKL